MKKRNRSPTTSPRRPAARFDVRIANRQTEVEIDKAWFRELARFVLEREGIQSAQLSVAFVDDATIHRLNRQFLEHDFPTDVLTFPYSTSPSKLEGEIVLGAEYGGRRAPEFGWPARTEIGLYLVHGVLHLCGYDDRSAPDARRMRRRQHSLLQDFLQRSSEAAALDGTKGRAAAPG